MKRWIVLCAVFIAVGVYIAWCILRPIPDIKPTITYIPAQQKKVEPNINFIGDSSQSIAVGDNSLIITNGNNEIRPIASTAKIMLAILTLVKNPIIDTQNSKTIPISDADENLYNQMLANSQSVVEVKSGINLNEYQALQALLLASANNIANKLAVWGYGSEQEYAKTANEFAKNNNLTDTTFADASGFSQETKSTSSDMLKLSILAQRYPVISEIVNQKTADLPIAGTIYNTNTDLGINGINGIKTGHTDQAGGCLLYSAHNTVDITGNIFGAQDKETALNATPLNIDNIVNNIQTQTTLHKGQPVGFYHIPWQGNIDLLVKEDLSINTWLSEVPKTDIIASNISKSGKYNSVATSSSQIQKKSESSLVLASNIKSPSILWKISHPF